jgi:hypothetical protein
MKFWFDVAQFVLTGLVGAYVYVSNRHRVSAERLRKLESGMDSRLDEHATRLAKVEETVRCGPSHEDIGRVHQRLDTVGNQLSEARGELKGIGKTVALIHQHLLNQSGKGSCD